MGAQQLSTSLWRERELLELLTFKLEEEQLLLTAGRARWLQHATREVEQVMDRLREAGLARTIEVSVLAAEWGASENATLRELIDHAPDGPWADIMSSHLRAMTELTEQIRDLRDTNTRFLRAGSRSLQDTLAGTISSPDTYDAKGVPDAAVVGARFFDSSL